MTEILKCGKITTSQESLDDFLIDKFDLNYKEGVTDFIKELFDLDDSLVEFGIESNSVDYGFYFKTKKNNCIHIITSDYLIEKYFSNFENSKAVVYIDSNPNEGIYNGMVNILEGSKPMDFDDFKTAFSVTLNLLNKF